MASPKTPFNVAPTGTVVTANKNFQPFDITGMIWSGVFLFINVTAVSGTNPTLQVSLQLADPVSFSQLAPLWTQIPGAITPIISTTGVTMLQVAPSITPVANQQIASHISNLWRVACTVGGTNPSFTLSIQSCYTG